MDGLLDTEGERDHIGADIVVQSVNLDNKVVLLVLRRIREKCINLMHNCFMCRLVSTDFIHFIYIFVKLHVFGYDIRFDSVYQILYIG